MRHLYSKRRYYIDEDSWHALANENYDGRGKLWRVQYAYGANPYDDAKSFLPPLRCLATCCRVYTTSMATHSGEYENGEKNEMYFTPKGMACWRECS